MFSLTYQTTKKLSIGSFYRTSAEFSKVMQAMQSVKQCKHHARKSPSQAAVQTFPQCKHLPSVELTYSNL